MIITRFLMEPGGFSPIFYFRAVTFLTMLATFPVPPLLLSNEEGFAPAYASAIFDYVPGTSTAIDYELGGL